jgi:hypothetical protein
VRGKNLGLGVGLVGVGEEAVATGLIGMVGGSGGPAEAVV